MIIQAYYHYLSSYDQIKEPTMSSKKFILDQLLRENRERKHDAKNLKTPNSGGGNTQFQ